MRFFGAFQFYQNLPDSSVVLATCLGFATFKFLAVDPDARNSVYFFSLFKNKCS